MIAIYNKEDMISYYQLKNIARNRDITKLGGNWA